MGALLLADQIEPLGLVVRRDLRDLACRRTQGTPCLAARSTTHHAISDPGRNVFAAGSVTDPDRYRAGSARSASVHPNGGPCSCTTVCPITPAPSSSKTHTPPAGLSH
jgi:hypothetical protein